MRTSASPRSPIARAPAPGADVDPGRGQAAGGADGRSPVTVQEKVTAIHDLAKDERVAVAVAADLLRRPEVAFKAMADRTARHIVNRAQIDHAVAGKDVAREKVAAGRVAIEKVVHAAGFVELVGACAAFGRGGGPDRAVAGAAGVHRHRAGDGRRAAGAGARRGGLDRARGGVRERLAG